MGKREQIGQYISNLSAKEKRDFLHQCRILLQKELDFSELGKIFILINDNQLNTIDIKYINIIYQIIDDSGVMLDKTFDKESEEEYINIIENLKGDLEKAQKELIYYKTLAQETMFKLQKICLNMDERMKSSHV